MERLKWAETAINYQPSQKNLYLPHRPGFIINPYYRQPGRFMAQRGSGNDKNGFTQRKIFYTFEEAKEWLDSLPEYPDPTPNVGREWTKDYIRVASQYVLRSEVAKHTNLIPDND